MTLERSRSPEYYSNHQAKCQSVYFPDRSRRQVLCSVGLLCTAAISGCLDEEATDLDPEEFDDDRLYQMAVAVERTELTFVAIERDVDDWLRLDVEPHVPLDEYVGELPPGVATPPDDIPLSQLAPPFSREVIDAYIRTVEQGYSSEGLRVTYRDDVCIGTFRVPVSRVEWFLDGQVSRQDVYFDGSFSYTVTC